MSRKNNQGRRRNQHAADLAAERALKAKQQEKFKRKAERALAKDGTGAKPQQRPKGFKLKRGVQVMGILIKDSETKRQAKERLLEAAAGEMNTEADGEEKVQGGLPGGPSKSRPVRKLVRAKLKAIKVAKGGVLKKKSLKKKAKPVPMAE